LKITEDNFIEQLINRNEDALKYVISTYGSSMKAVINRILYLYPQDSEECLDDAILKIWEKITYFDQSKNSFRNWSVAVAKYTALNRLKKLSNVQQMLDIDELSVSDEKISTDNDIFDDFFMDLISCLSNKDKAMFIRLFWNGETVDEAAKRLKVQKSNIYNRISRAKKKIIHKNPELFVDKE